MAGRIILARGWQYVHLQILSSKATYPGISNCFEHRQQISVELVIGLMVKQVATGTNQRGMVDRTATYAAK